jgi:O-antigen/teichoic acid export membrane protein
MENRKPSVKKNFVYNSICQILVLIVPFVTTPYVSRVLGAENIGKYSYAAAMVSYFTLIAALGTTTYGQRKIAFYRDDKKELSKVFWNTFLLRSILSLLSLSLYIVYVFLLEGSNSINEIMILSIINVALDITWFYQGIEYFKNVVIRNLLVRIVCLVGIFIFVKSELDTWKYVLILMLAQILGSLTMWRDIPRYIERTSSFAPFEGIKDSFLIFLPSIAIQIYTMLDKSMIQWITKSDYANGCYEQSERIARLALTIVSSVGTVVLPRVANLFHNENLNEAKRYVYQAFRVVWALSIPIMFGLMSVASVFIPVFLGEGYEAAIGLLMIFSVLVVVVSLSSVVGVSYLIPTKQQNVYTLAVTIAAASNVVVNLLLIPRIGAFGAAIASVIAELVGVSVQIRYCISKGQLTKKGIFGACPKYLTAGSIMFIIVELIKKEHFSSGTISLFVLVIVGMCTYGSMLIVLRDDFTINCIKKLFWSKRRN